ncbi:MAG: hypothetical protein JW720_00535 [Sedimentisphaerales bacterium]|nr:hypothetical protein [Sedimentisphaerales bacterium]
MALRGPNTHDLTKIHEEVNQLLNQRFIVSTFAITVFGLVTAWLLPRQPLEPNTPLGGFVFIGSIFLTTLLFVLFLLWYFLKSMRFILTTYLRITNKSDWEFDFKKYRQMSSLAYSGPQCVIFLVLNFFAAILPLMLSWVYAVQLKPRPIFWASLCIGAAYEIFILGVGFRGWFDRESKIESCWLAANEEVSALPFPRTRTESQGAHLPRLSLKRWLWKGLVEDRIIAGLVLSTILCVVLVACIITVYLAITLLNRLSGG